MAKKTFLITGGAGFLGSHLAECLVKEGRVVVVDIVNNLPKKIRKLVKFYQMDISSKKIKEIFKKEKPNIVYHLAGPIGLRCDINSPVFKKNLKFLKNLNYILECCVKYRVEKIIFFSSGGAIYEKSKIIPTAENYLAHPASIYGLANLIIEKYIKNYYQKYGLGFTILRLSNVYGPRQWGNGVIPSLIAKIINNEPPVIYGDGKQGRDFIFVDDAIKASILAIQDKKNNIYNISSNKETRINEILNKITKILNKKSDPVYLSNKDRGVERSRLDNSKIKKELGWKPKIEINQGLKKTIKWFKTNYVRK